MSNFDKAVSLIYQAELDHIGHTNDLRSHPSVYVAALQTNGLLAPDLPEPMQPWEAERTGGTPGSRWYGYEDDGNDDGSGMYSPHRYVDAYPGEVWIDGHILLAPEDAKAYAHALLAAADYAEKEQANE